jgi:8-oxo-dGTP diphosphatase
MKTLLRIWRILPMWMHVLASKLARSRFRAAVAAIIFNEEGQVLLFKHTYRKFEWGIPAGSLEYREQPADAIIREFFEETGMKIEIEKLFTVVSAKEDHHLTVIYLCKIIAGDFNPSHEISEMRYFHPNELPRMLYAEKDLIHWAAKELS